MALKGEFNTTGGYDGRNYKCSWTATQSIADNTSTISWTLSCYGGDDRWYNERTLNLYIAGGSPVYSKTNKVSRYVGTIATGKKTVKHNADGSLSFTASINAATYTVAINAKGSKTFTLDKIPRAATITAAPNFNDEENPKITYSNLAGTAVDSLRACISFDGSKDDIAYRDISKTGTAYTFNLTAAERNVLRNATTTANSRKVRFYVETVINGETYRNNVEKTLTIINANPTLNPTAVDVGSVSKTLTGDAANKVIKFYNSMDVAANASALKGATIKSYKISSGGKSITTESGRLSNVESNSFVFTATDSRGNSTTKTLNKTLINYVKLTCNLAVNAPTTDGNLTMEISGNYFNGTFGAVANALTVEYRYKVDSGSYSSWTAATATKSGNTYKATVNVSGLDYRSTYTFQARAGDKIYNGDTEAFITSAAKTVKTMPVFDWGADDFAFNVPVGLNVDGNSYSLLGLLYALTTTYELKCDVSAGANYSSVTATAHLVGGSLRIGLNATRKEAVNIGNITNEVVATINVNHGGKINNLYRVDFNSGTEGGAATFDAQASAIDDNTYKITVNLCGTTTAATGYNAYFVMPCSIITKAYV